jgi:hypothetical protein
MFSPTLKGQTTNTTDKQWTNLETLRRKIGKEKISKVSILSFGSPSLTQPADLRESRTRAAAMCDTLLSYGFRPEQLKIVCYAGTNEVYETVRFQVYKPSRLHYIAFRTNLLADAFLLPSLGIEWRIDPAFGLKVDGSLAWWNKEKGPTQKMWVINPEVRWYLALQHRLYLGISANIARYNLYRGAMGKLFSKENGYQGTLWTMGATVGYQLPLSRSFSVDFGLGAGYYRSNYHKFYLSDENKRTSHTKDVTKKGFGLTQAGISLAWTIQVK